MSKSSPYTWKPEEQNVLSPLTSVELLTAVSKLSIFILFTVGILMILIPIVVLGLKYQKFLIFRIWARTALFMCSIKVEISGSAIPTGLIISNHISWIDILAILSVTRGSFVSKAEVKGWFIVGSLAKLADTIFIERNPHKIKDQIKVLGESLSNKGLIILFPESTSSDGQRLLPFRSGLLQSLFRKAYEHSYKIKAQSLTLYYKPEHDLDKDFFAWYHSRTLLGHMLKVLATTNKSQVYLTFDKAHDIDEFANRKELSKFMFENISKNLLCHLDRSNI